MTVTDPRSGAAPVRDYHRQAVQWHADRGARDDGDRDGHRRLGAGAHGPGAGHARCATASHSRTFRPFRRGAPGHGVAGSCTHRLGRSGRQLGARRLPRRGGVIRFLRRRSSAAPRAAATS